MAALGSKDDERYHTDSDYSEEEGGSFGDDASRDACVVEASLLPSSTAVPQFLSWAMGQTVAIAKADIKVAPPRSTTLEVDWDPALVLNETDFFFGNERQLLVSRCRVPLVSGGGETWTPSMGSRFLVQDLQIRTSGDGSTSPGAVGMYLTVEPASHGSLREALTELREYLMETNTELEETGLEDILVAEEQRNVRISGAENDGANDAPPTAELEVSDDAQGGTAAAGDAQVWEPSRFVLVLRYASVAGVKNLLAACERTLCHIDDSGESTEHQAIVHLFRTPADTAVKQDKWWSKKYPRASAKAKRDLIEAVPTNRKKTASTRKDKKGGSREKLFRRDGTLPTDAGGSHDSDPYTAYRVVIDGLIESKVTEVLNRWDTPPAGTEDELLSSAFSTTGPGLDEVPGSPVRCQYDVAELCGGDGSLGERILLSEAIVPSSSQSAGTPPVSRLRSYTLIERNKQLLSVARKKLGAASASVSAALESKGAEGEGAVISLIEVDTASAQGQETIRGQKVDLWVASGSTLNGQVRKERCIWSCKKTWSLRLLFTQPFMFRLGARRWLSPP